MHDKEKAISQNIIKTKKMKIGGNDMNLLCKTLIIVMMFGVTITAFSQIDSPDVGSQTIVILQDFVDDFDHGDDAGGNLLPFGNVLDEDTSGIVEDEGREGAGDFGFQVSTVSTGFDTLANEGNFVGLAKDVGEVTLTNGDEARFDASGFNAISYFIRNPGAVGAGSPVTAQLELVIGDGGGNPDTTSVGGSTWAQSIPINFADLTNTYERVILTLDNVNFVRTVGPSNGDAIPTDIVPLLNDISAVNVTMLSNGETGTQRSIQVDDINFFDNNVLTITQDRVFAKSDGSTDVVITATITGAGGAAVAGEDLAATLGGDCDGSIAPASGTTDASGEIEFTYTVGSDPAVCEILIEQQ